jgi:hypothetical protein
VVGSGLAMLKLQIQPGEVEVTSPMTFAGTEADAGNLWVGYFPMTIYVEPGQFGQFIPEAPFLTPETQATVSGYLLECSAVQPCAQLGP